MPVVPAEAPGQDSLTRAWHDLRSEGRLGAEAAGLARAVRWLESGHQRWRTTHYSLAAAMLGSAHGSGYTEGVPYLRGCPDNRLFDLDEVAGTAAARRCPTAAWPIADPVPAGSRSHG